MPAANQAALRYLSATGALAIALIVSIQVLGTCIHFFDTASVGDFGIATMNVNDGRITDVSPGSPADRAGLQPGDVILNDQADLAKIWWSQPPGQHMTVTFEHGSQLHVVSLVATPIHLAASDIGTAALAIANFAYLAVGLFLVVRRPSRMTWAFYLCGLAWWWVSGPANPFLPASLIAPYVYIWNGVIVPWSLVGFVVFCLSFPNGVPLRWRLIVDIGAPTLAFIVLPFQLLQVAGPPMIGSFVGDNWPHVWDALIIAISIAGFAAMRSTYLASAGPDRQRIKWVVFGLALTSVAGAVVAFDQEGWLSRFEWVSAFEASAVALPLAVMYAAIRHRVIDVRFAISRALVLGIIASVVGVLFFTLDAILSPRFTGSSTMTAIYAACAIVVGLVFGDAQRRLTPIIDSFVFAQRSRWRVRSEDLADVLRRCESERDAYGPLTAGIADAFSLASVALFERIDDGGYIRVAASGWAEGSMRHILSDDPIVRRLDAKRIASVIDVDEREWSDRAVPPGTGFPLLAVPLSDSKRVRALLVVGSHENGSGPGRDEIASLRGLAAAAFPLFEAHASRIGMPRGAWSKA
jgi:hypothetical protein